MPTGEVVGGYLEVGRNENHEVVLNHPDLKPDANGVGHIVFSPRQARNLAALLNKHAQECEDARAGKLPPAHEEIAEG